MNQIFEWDEAKAASNYRKHGVTFQMAADAFNDPFIITEQDRIENGELRWRSLARTGEWVILVIAHTLRDDETGAEIVRIISARKADRKEKRQYEHG